MINRKAFFEIFFYNREDPTREQLETAESVWRAYMKKYGLGLDASAVGQPTYDEVREITFLANASFEMMAAREAGIPVNPVPAPPEEEPEEVMEAPMEEIPEEPAEEAVEEVPEEAPEEIIEEAPEEIPEEVEPAAEEAEEEAAAEEEPPLPEIPRERKAPVKLQPVEKPAPMTAPGCDVSIWVEQLIHWCETKGFQCIRSMDDGDCYLHVYLPHKKEVLPVGKWCLKKDTNGADLASEISKLYAYCTGFADCFERLTR